MGMVGRLQAWIRSGPTSAETTIEPGGATVAIDIATSVDGSSE